MELREFSRLIKQIDPDTPQHLRLAAALQEGAGCNGAWYATEKEHWLGWLREYSGPGAYSRNVLIGRDARFIYNHGHRAPMLFWLAEAVGVEHENLNAAFRAVVTAPLRNASQSSALRKVLPRELVEFRLIARTTVSWLDLPKKRVR